MGKCERSPPEGPISKKMTKENAFVASLSSRSIQFTILHDDTPLHRIQKSPGGGPRSTRTIPLVKSGGFILEYHSSKDRSILCCKDFGHNMFRCHLYLSSYGWQNHLCTCFHCNNVGSGYEVAKIWKTSACRLFFQPANVLYDGSALVKLALTNTGIKAPVGMRNSRCPITLRSEAIDPEWVVNEIYVLPSWVNISSSSFFMRI